MDRAQDEVENAKKQVDINHCAGSNGLLYQARESRNFLHNRLEMIVTAREVLMLAQDEVPS
jgi:hypothetical protein